MSFDLNECSQDCFDCIRSYRKKHRLSGLEENPFRISCSGIPKQYVTEDLYSILPAEQVKTAEIMLDPVVWAREVLDWHCLDPDGEVWKRKNPKEYYDWIKKHPGEDILGYSRYHRPYQALMLRCLHEDSNIFMADGAVKKIKDVKVDDKVITYNEGKKTTQSSYRVLNKWFSGYRDTYKLHLENGDTLKVTDNHPILSWFKDGDENPLFKCKAFKRVYKSLSDGVDVGTKIYTLNKFDLFGQIDDDDLAKILGYIVTDGYVRNTGLVGEKHVLCFTNTRPKLVLEFRRLLIDRFNINAPIKYYPERIDKEGIVHKKHWTVSVFDKDSSILSFLRKIGCVDKTNREMSILNYSFLFSKKSLSCFINRCWSGDGCVYNSTCGRNEDLPLVASLTLSSGNLEFLSLYRLLLKKVGIYASHIYEDIKPDGAISRVLNIGRISDVEIFFDFCGPVFGKEEQSKIALSETLKRRHHRRHGNMKTLSRTKIVDIKYLGLQPVYDIEVDVRHNFIADGVVVHNCRSQYKAFRIGRRAGKTECLVISILYNMFVKPGIPEGEGFKSIVIAPYQEQIDGIFKRIDQLINLNISTSNAVSRYVKSPSYRLELHNSSMVKGLTAGTKSGGNAASVRGSDANQLVFDETDYLSQADINAALAVTIDHPDATVWMSSTPSGARSKFYENCNSRLYKEFHFPSSVNPMWNKETEAFFREGLTEIAYEHEIEAAWGEQEEGVFQNVYIEAAQSDFEYKGMPRDLNWRYTLGVDWNDVKIGTSIAVLGFNPAVQRFYLVDKQKVSRDGWNQTAACRKIIELNQFWRPEWIYVDQGHGSTQIEMLRLLGWESLKRNGAGHPDSRLKDIVKGYSFGSTVEIFDLVTKQPIKKPAKPFLVENTVRKFEHGVFSYPKSDDLLTKQLNGYIVDHTTTSGVPVYKASDETVGDHDLDALMLAFVAFTLETTDFGKPRFSIDFAFSGKIGEKITPEEMPGFIVVKNDKKIDERAKNRPDMNRTDGVSKDNKVILTDTSPGKHLNPNNNSVRLWSWSEGKNIARSSIGLSVRTNRPVRKNI